MPCMMKLIYVSVSIIFLLCSSGHHRGFTYALPSSSVVCDGDDLELSCSMNESFIIWTSAPSVFDDLTIQRFGIAQMRTTQYLNSTTFNISRTSGPNELPLESTLQILSITEALNGTEITCQNIAASNSTSTVIIVLNGLTQDLQDINITTYNEQYISHGVMIFMEWSLSNSSYRYRSNVSIDPPEEQGNSRFLDITLIELNITLLYNTRYNISIVATQFCGEARATISFEVYYNKPAVLCRSLNTSSVRTSESQSFLPGVNVSFSCPPGMVLIGPNATTCRENGDWEPDPRGVTCTETDAITTYQTTSWHDGVTGGKSGAAIGVVTSTIIIIIVGIIALSMIYYIRTKRKVTHNEYVTRSDVQADHESDQNQRFDRGAVDDNESTTNGLVYAEVGLLQLSSKTTLQRSIHDIDCDDDQAVEYAHLNHNINRRSQKTLENECDANNLLVNLDNLLVQLKSHLLNSKWIEFGRAVGIDEKKLADYDRQCSPDDCVVEMLDYWLRNSEKKKTWKDVAHILKQINLGQLANEIEKVYITGKLPVEVDMDRIPPQQELQLSAIENPPPLPPKTAASDQMQLGDLHITSIISVPADAIEENSLPPLPPKPTKCCKSPVPEIPARPPKRVQAIQLNK